MMSSLTVTLPPSVSSAPQLRFAGLDCPNQHLYSAGLTDKKAREALLSRLEHSTHPEDQAMLAVLNQERGLFRREGKQLKTFLAGEQTRSRQTVAQQVEQDRLAQPVTSAEIASFLGQMEQFCKRTLIPGLSANQQTSGFATGAASLLQATQHTVPNLISPQTSPRPVINMAGVSPSPLTISTTLPQPMRHAIALEARAMAPPQQYTSPMVTLLPCATSAVLAQGLESLPSLADMTEENTPALLGSIRNYALLGQNLMTTHDNTASFHPEHSHAGLVLHTPEVLGHVLQDFQKHSSDPEVRREASKLAKMAISRQVPRHVVEERIDTQQSALDLGGITAPSRPVVVSMGSPVAPQPLRQVATEPASPPPEGQTPFNPPQWGQVPVPVPAKVAPQNPPLNNGL
jgi:hypothetical protein